MLIEPNGSVRIHSAMESDAQQFLASTDTIGGDKGTSPSSRLRILIVEDETILAMQLEDMIEARPRGGRQRRISRPNDHEGTSQPT